MHGEPDRPAGVLEPALDRLTDPQRRVRREPEALAPVELLHGTDQPQHALLDEVAERQPLALVAASVRHDQTQVRVDHPLLGGEVALLDALGQLDLLARLEQLVAARLAQEKLERVHRRVDVVLVLVRLLGTRRDIGEGGRFGYLFFGVLNPDRRSLNYREIQLLVQPFRRGRTRARPSRPVPSTTGPGEVGPDAVL